MDGRRPGEMGGSSSRQKSRVFANISFSLLSLPLAFRSARLKKANLFISSYPIFPEEKEKGKQFHHETLVLTEGLTDS